MPIHCCAMQGRIDAIQALLFFDTEGSIKRNLEMENEVFNLSLPYIKLNGHWKAHFWSFKKVCMFYISMQVFRTFHTSREIFENAA